MFSHPTKPEIHNWVDVKELEFAQKESEGYRWTLMKWLEWYIYSNIHSIFFAEFPIVLYEWLFKLETQKKNFQGGEPTEWTLFLIEWLKRINNSIYVKGRGLLGRKYHRRIYH